MRFLLIIFMLASSILVQAATPKREFTKPTGYERTAEMYKMYGINEFGRILMLGDSITYGAYWNELMKRSDIINRGIPGDTTFWMLDRLEYTTTGRIEKAFVLAGINDISKYQLPASIFARYTKIIDFLVVQGIKPHIQSVIFLGKLNPKYDAYNARIAELNKLLKEYADKNGYAFIDLNPTLAPDGFLKDEYTYDGTHLTAQGYTLWRDILTPYMSDTPSDLLPVSPDAVPAPEPAVTDTVPAPEEITPPAAESAPVQTPETTPESETITVPSK
ncbi:MAG: GDSL-type esterase/lipase family protein [Deferribacterales bacterium]